MTDTNEPEVTIDTDDKPTPPDMVMIASLVSWAHGKGPDIQSKVLELMAAIAGSQRAVQLEAFLSEYEALCVKHKMEICGDPDGGLYIDDFTEGTIEAASATDARETPEEEASRKAMEQIAAAAPRLDAHTETLTVQRANVRVACFKYLEARGCRYSPTESFPWAVTYGTNEVRIAIVFRDDELPTVPWVSFEEQVTEPVRWEEFAFKLEGAGLPR